MASELLQVLANSLNAESNTRIAAEIRLNEILATAACIALRKYISERWSPYFSTFKGTPPSYETKVILRSLILQGLSDPHPKIRSLIAHTLSTIAHCDWPDEYPDLLSDLIKLLSSPSPNSVHGAMQVFVEFVRSDVTEDQILPVLRELLPVLMSILLSEANSPVTRSQAIKVFSQCIEYLYMVKDQHPEATKEAVSSILPSWLSTFRQLLLGDLGAVAPQDGNWVHLAIRLQVYRTLNVIHTAFPNALGASLVELVTISLQTLRLLSPLFTEHYLRDEDGSINSNDKDAVTLPQLASSILDFVTNCSRGGKGKAWFSHEENINLCIQSSFCWSQVTRDDEITWENDLSVFLEDDEDDGDSTGPRAAAFDLINSLIDRWPEAVISALQANLNNVLLQVSASREQDPDNWWRPVEAALACSACNAGDVLDFVEEKTQAGHPVLFDPSGLLGRCLVFASKYSNSFSAEVASRYGSLSAQLIESQRAELPLKLSAVKAIRNIYEETGHALLEKEAPNIVRVLGPLLEIANDDSLCIVLETLRAVLSVHDGNWIDSVSASVLTNAFLTVWHKNIRDPVICSVLEDTFEALAKSHGRDVFKVSASIAAPAFIEAISSTNHDQPWVLTSAIEFATKYVSKDDAPLELVTAIEAALLNCVNNTEDRDIQQAGVECLNQLIKTHATVTLGWTDSTGRNGLDHSLTLVASLLDPSGDESGGLVVGDLVINLLRKAGDAILPVLPGLLEAMIKRMTNAKTPTFLQSLIIPFALLLQMHADSTLDFLEKTTVMDLSSSQSRTGLDILLGAWCDNAEAIQGAWASRISLMTLCQLFSSQRNSLGRVMVKGDMILRSETRDVTRSRAKQTPHQYSSISFPAKVLKLVLNEVQTEGDFGNLTAHDTAEIDSDDGDENWADEEQLIQGFKPEEFALLSEMLGPKGKLFEEDGAGLVEFEEYPEFPVSDINMKEHLVDFLKGCNSNNTNDFANLVGHLTTEETLTLRQALKQ